MKLKVLVIVAICFILSILLVNSQETKCPPDCSSPNKITETSYLDSNSYKDKKFYENSDPKKWNFRDSNFDYSKIPLAKYKELPYTNPDVDHSMLDPNKYICAFGCCTCTFKIATTAKKIQYSTDGVLHAKTGLARIPGNFPANTLFIATNEGIFIGLPKIDDKFKLDISNVGSATVITNNQKITLSNGLTINGGRLSFADNQAFVSKNYELELEGIRIKPKGNDVLVYFDGKEHQGNYISYGQNKLIAEGNNFDLEFTNENKLVKVFSGSELIAVISPILYQSDYLYESDYLYISLGDGISKSGKISLTNRENQNLLSLLETKGYIRMWNDRNDVIIDGARISNNYYRTYIPGGHRQGSVSMQIIAGGDVNKNYIFDENRRIIITTPEQTKKVDQLREEMLKQHNLVLTGFFDYAHLIDFSNSFNGMGSLGIDFFEYEKIKGKKMEILEYFRSVNDPLEITVFADPPNAIVIWSPTTRNNPLWKVTTYNYGENEIHSGIITHEIGHVLWNKDKSFSQNFRDQGKDYNIYFTDYVVKGRHNRGPNELFPSDRSKYNLPEFVAEIFRSIVHRPQWFTDPYEGQFIINENKYTRLNQPVSDETLKKRQAFRDIWLKELEKYKKNNK